MAQVSPRDIESVMVGQKAEVRFLELFVAPDPDHPGPGAKAFLPTR